MTMKWTRRILGHLLLRSLVRSYRTACYARALCCSHSFARSLTHSGAHGKRFMPMNGMRRFYALSSHSAAMVDGENASPLLTMGRLFSSKQALPQSLISRRSSSIKNCKSINRRRNLQQPPTDRDTPPLPPRWPSGHAKMTEERMSRRPTMDRRTDRQTDRQTDRWTDRRTDKRTDKRTRPACWRRRHVI